MYRYKVYSESNLPPWAVNKTNNEKIYIYKNTYILKLLLNVVTARTEALLSWNKFLYEYACESNRRKHHNQGPDFDDMSSFFLYVVNVAFKY
jgi:hypothetical protein